MAVREFIFCTGVLLLVGFFQSTVGLKCYSCILCDDPFNAVGVTVMTVPDNAGYSCMKVMTGGMVIMRNATQNCITGDVPSVGSVWCCQTDLCNGAGPMASTTTHKPSSLGTPVTFSISTLMVALIVSFIILFK